MSAKKTDKIILVIDDEDAIRHVASRVLQLEGYTIYQAADGETGMSLIEGTGAIDLILLDLTLPDIDGWTIFNKMRQTPRLSNVPVIIFSATATTPQKEKAMKMGAADYLVKPIGANSLKKAVAAALK